MLPATSEEYVDIDEAPPISLKTNRRLKNHKHSAVHREVIKNILIVDDDSDIREAFSQILEFEGYNVITAANGLEALERLQKFRPSLILLDLMMPVMNGHQFREKQRADAQISDIPVIVLTADNRVQQRLIDPDVIGYLKKPVRLDTLLDTVKHFCS